MRVPWWLSCSVLLATPCGAERLVFAVRPGAAMPAPPAPGAIHRLDEGPASAPARDATGTRWRLDRARVFVLELPDPAAATATLEALAADPRVAWAERDAIREPCVWPAGGREAAPLPLATTGDAASLDPLLDDGRQWGLDHHDADGPYGGLAHADIHARDAWTRSRGDASVVLALADSGVDPAHPDLAATLDDGSPRLMEGFDATLTPGGTSADSLGHGTQVAGVMAARTGDGAHFDSLGVAGVCGGDGRANPGCRLIPVRVSAGHSSGISTVDETRGIAWAVDHGARVVNASFAATSPSILERHAILDAAARGVLVVCAAGNRALDRPGLPMYPAALAGDGLCASVGASDVWDRRASWSSYGSWLDLVAPGVDVWSTALTYPNGAGNPPLRYAVNSGTSFAAPFVSGVAGLMLALRPELDAADLAPLMRGSATDIEAPGPDTLTGAGRLDAFAALATLSPDHALVHGVAATRVVAVTHDTLTLAEGGQPLMDALGRRAAVARLTVLATVPVPDSLRAPWRAWVRVARSTTLREARALAWLAPWAEVVASDADSVTLRGAVYRIEDARVAALGAIDTLERWLPVPVDSARIAYTLWGRIPVTPSAAPPAPGPPASARLAAAPNPFGRATRVTGRPGVTVGLFDLNGRRVRTLRLGADGAAEWDGREASGARAAAGLYLMRGSDGSWGRLVRIE